MLPNMFPSPMMAGAMGSPIMDPSQMGMPNMFPMQPMQAQAQQAQQTASSFADTANLANSLAEESVSLSAKNDCAACDRFSTEMLDISSDAYPGGANAAADAELCERVSPEFKDSCASYVHHAGGLGDVDVLLAQNPSSLCAHLSECAKSGESDEEGDDATAGSAFLADDASHDDEDDEDDDEDDDSEDDEESTPAFVATNARRGELGTGFTSGQLDSFVDNLKRTQAIQMMNAKQMSDMELMNNALKLHDLQMQPALHELPCIDRDDADCATSGLLHGMNYLMMSNTMPNGGLENGGLSLAMMASAFPNSPHQNA